MIRGINEYHRHCHYSIAIFDTLRARRLWYSSCIFLTVTFCRLTTSLACSKYPIGDSTHHRELGTGVQNQHSMVSTEDNRANGNANGVNSTAGSTESGKILNYFAIG